MVTTCFGISDTTTKLLSRGLSKAMSETEAGFNTDIVVKELLDLLVSKHILKREVDKLLQPAKTHFIEVPEEPDINDINGLVYYLHSIISRCRLYATYVHQIKGYPLLLPLALRAKEHGDRAS